jgi:dUTP pyrophosphatase
MDALLVPTGLSVFSGGAIGSRVEGEELSALILPRSGMGHKRGLILGNSVGLIDPDYQGELMVSLWNRNTERAEIVHRGDKIAQLKFVPTIRVDLVAVDYYNTDTGRGSGGFGHTGDS